MTYSISFNNVFSLISSMHYTPSEAFFAAITGPRDLRFEEEQNSPEQVA